MKNLFEVGDLVKGTERGSTYGVTNTEMTKGEVIDIYSNGNMSVRVLEHKNSHWIDAVYAVKMDKFDPYCNVTMVIDQPVKSCDFGKIKPIGREKAMIDKVKVTVEKGMTFIVIDETYTICVPTKDDIIGISVKDPSDEANGEYGKALAMYRTAEKMEKMEKRHTGGFLGGTPRYFCK